MAELSEDKASSAGSEYFYVTSQSARAFAQALLEAHNVPPTNAAIVAKCLVEADIRGVDTHGMNRLPSYIARIQSGVLSPTAQPEVTQVTPVVAAVDGKNAFGSICASMGMSRAVEMAEQYGIGMVGIKHSNHFGMSASYVLQAIEANMLALVFTNSSPALPAYGGTEKLLGVSPIAAGAPGDPSFVLDMAPSVAARGKIHKALRRGERIPEGWALDKDGNQTTDPASALAGGVMLPMGDHKGSGLALMMDVFSGVLSGSAFAGGVTGPYDPSKEADVGHFLVAIRPDLFISSAEFRERMKVLYEKTTGGKKMTGVERIWFPGEIELEMARKRETTGIPFVEAEIEALNREAEEVGVSELVLERFP